MGRKRGAGLRSNGHKVQDKDGRKAKKNELKARREGKYSAGKDMGVPDLSAEKRAIERTKAFKRQQHLVDRQKKNKNARDGVVGKKRGKMLAPNLGAITARAQSRTTAFEKKKEHEAVMAEMASDVSGSLPGDNSKKTYMRELRKTVAAADVVLEVLDARDPQGCRVGHLHPNVHKNVALIVNLQEYKAVNCMFASPCSARPSKTALLRIPPRS
jgi:hypothetical protein